MKKGLLGCLGQSDFHSSLPMDKSPGKSSVSNKNNGKQQIALGKQNLGAACLRLKDKLVSSSPTSFKVTVLWSAAVCDKTMP